MLKYITIIACLFTASCSKEKFCANCIGNNIESNAVITNLGAPPYGCDWTVEVNDSVYYHPISLADSFKQQGLAVTITYRFTTDTFYCGDFILAKFRVINISSINKR